MMGTRLPCIDRLREAVDYDASTGAMTWKSRPTGHFVDERTAKSWNTKRVGTPAFGSRRNGYRCGHFDGVLLEAHRVAFALHNGIHPNGEVDHINGVRNDNRAANLRDVTSSQNRRNGSRPSHNTSGDVGICWDSARQRWKSYITVGERTINIGRYISRGDALIARKAAEKVLGFHPNHGKPL